MKPGTTPKLAAIVIVSAIGLLAALAVYQNFDVVTRVLHGGVVPSTASTADPAGAMSAWTAAAPPREAGPAELALVAPLVKGGKLLDYTVLAIYGVERGGLTVVLGKEKALVYLTVAMASDAGPLAPAVVGPYAIFKSILNAPAEEAERLQGAFGEILRANVAVPAPPGLATFQPGPMPAPPVASGISAPPVAPATRDARLDCDEAVTAWTQRASARTGLTITPGGCPSGVVRLKVQGAGCDFEVRREGGFQRTADGSFGVSPIVDLDWDAAPEPMKKALAGLLAALAEDHALTVPTGRVRNHPEGQPDLEARLGSWRVLTGLCAVVIALLGAVTFVLLRRRRRAAPPAPPASPG